MELISDSHVPKYAQIADIFRQRIARGVWAQGLRLPANEDLAAEFGVSRVTIRQAVDLLARDGIIEARQGRGTFITGTLKQDRWLKVETTLSTSQRSTATHRRRSSTFRKAAPTRRCCPKTARRRRIMSICGACTRATRGRIA